MTVESDQGHILLTCEHVTDDWRDDGRNDNHLRNYNKSHINCRNKGIEEILHTVLKYFCQPLFMGIKKSRLIYLNFILLCKFMQHFCEIRMTMYLIVFILNFEGIVYR